MLVLMSAVEKGQMSAVETRHLPRPPLPSSLPRLGPAPPLLGRVGVGASVLSQQQTSVLSQQQTSASAFITQHQHSVSTISILWRLRQQPTSGYHEGWDIKRPCAPMVAMIPTGYGFGYSQTRMT